MMMINGLFETHINVTDLERSMHFYGEVLGLELGIIDEARRIAFYWVGARGEAMLGVWEKPKEQVLPQHFAFRCSIEAILEQAAAYLEARHLPYHNFLNDDTKRPQVFGWMPAVAIYFNDPDGHSLEFIAMLPDPARLEVGVVSWEAWQALRSSERTQD
jgi:catechol 2,3-dioxygenase-like lactoylglutathione lyase family enzyme